MRTLAEAPFSNRKATPFSWTLLLYVTCTACVMAQSRPELGLRVSTPVRGPITASSTLTNCRCGLFESIPRHVSIGASVSVPIFRRMRLRLDPGYQRIGITETSVGQVLQGGVGSPMGEVAVKYGTTANRWLIPILVEAELSRHLRFGIGPEFSVVTGSRTTFEVRNPFAPDRSGMANYLHPVSPELFGIGAALEFPFRFSKFVIAPELHYHRWTGKHYGGIWSPDEVSWGIAVRI
jgi:hypothetical protein